jgi:hypothetical protein
MKKFFQALSLIAVLVIMAMMFGTQIVQALRDAAAPAPLPYGLSAQDTMASVERKLGQPKVPFAPQAGWEPGLPDGGGSSDHMHYWAVYERFGLTIVYNTPSLTDKNATINAIYVND